MAIRLKTIEYGFSASISGQAINTYRYFPTLNIYAPETGSTRKFRNCFLEFFAQDFQAAAGTPTSASVRLKLGPGAAAGASNTLSASVGTTFTNTGEHQSYYLIHDVTTLFTGSAFSASATTSSVELHLGFPVVIVNNASAKLVLTYEYDDIANTRIKTVRIPMDSITSSVKVAPTFIDTLPALDTYLPESNKVYRDIFFEIQGNDGLGTAIPLPSSLASSMSFAFNYPSESLYGINPFATGVITSSLASPRPFWYILKRTDLNTTTTQSLWALSATPSSSFDCFSVTCYVTYEYDHSASTNVMNNVMFCAADDSGVMGGPTNINRSRFKRKLFIQEPEITMSRCGVYHSFVDQANMAFRPKVTSSAYNPLEFTYMFPTTPATAGGFTLGNRFDSGSDQGQAMDLVRGENTFYFDWYRTSSFAGTLGSMYTAYALLNYTSKKSSQPGGDANHYQIRKLFGWPLAAHTVYSRQFTSSFNIMANDSSSYWLGALGATAWTYTAINTAPSGNGYVLNIQANSGSGIVDGQNDGFGWDDAWGGIYIGEGEIGPMWSTIRLRDLYRRYPNDPQGGFILEQPHLMKFDSAYISSLSCGYLWMCYHNIKYTLTGSIAGATGNSSGITVDFFRSDTDELVVSTTSSVGGAFNATWYDNTIPLYAVARQDDTHVGRSSNSTASGAP